MSERASDGVSKTDRPELQVDDEVFAKLAAYEAVRTPGVARLHPYAIQAARAAVTAVARRATARLAGADAATQDDTVPEHEPADPGAVDVERDAGTGSLTLTVRIVASTQPPILQAVGEVQQRISARIAEVTGVVPVVVVNVLDVEPPDA